jgi:hypothetical protein
MQRKPRSTGKFIALRDAEAEYGIPYHRLYRWVGAGLIQRISEDVIGHSILVKRADLDAFLDSNMSGAQS